MSRQSWIRCARIVASVALLGALVATQDVGAAVDALSAVSAWVVVFAVALFALRNVAHALRWWIVLRGLGGALPFGWVHRAVYAGASASLLLPSSVGGDVVRGALARSAGLSTARATSSVVFDRGIGLAAMAALVVGVSFTLPAGVVPRAVSWIAWTLLAVGGVVGLVWILKRALDDLRWIAPAFALSVIVHLASLGSVIVFARGVGAETPFVLVAGCTAIAWIASLAPVSVGGFGVRETVLVTLLGRVGVAPEQALAITLLWTALILVQAVVGAVALPARPPEDSHAHDPAREERAAHA